MGTFKPLMKIQVTKTEDMRRCAASFKKACELLRGRDAVEEFVSAGISTLGQDEFREFDFNDIKLEYFDDPVPIPTFEVVRGVYEDNENLISQVEHTAGVIIGPYTERGHKCLMWETIRVQQELLHTVGLVLLAKASALKPETIVVALASFPKVMWFRMFIRRGARDSRCGNVCSRRPPASRAWGSQKSWWKSAR